MRAAAAGTAGTAGAATGTEGAHGPEAAYGPLAHRRRPAPGGPRRSSSLALSFARAPG